MSQYDLYAHDPCERCGASTAVRAISFFTDERICMPCLAQEGHLKSRLRDAGINLALLEGCGTLPRYAGPAPPRPPARLTQAAGRAAAAADPSAPCEQGVTADDLRAALRRLRARSALLRIPPAALPPGRDLPPTH